MKLSNLFIYGLVLCSLVLPTDSISAFSLLDTIEHNPIEEARKLKKEALRFENDGQYHQSVKKIRKAKEILIQHCGLVDSFTLTVMEIEAYGLMKNERFHEADSMVKLIIENVPKIDPKPFKLLARCKGIQGDLIRELKSAREAVPYYIEAYDTYASSQESDEKGLCVYLNKIAKNYYKIGDLNKAKQYFYMSKNVLKNNPKYKNQIARASLNLGACLNALSMTHLAKIEINNSIDYIKEEIGNESYRLYYAYKILAESFANESDFSEALRYREQALAILQKKMKPDHFSVLDTKLGNIKLLIKSNKFEAALKALDLLAPSIRKKQNVKLDIRYNYLRSRVLMEIDKLDEAELLLLDALEMSIEKYGECALKNIVVYNDLVLLYFKQEKYEEAIELVKLEIELENFNEVEENGRFANYSVKINSLLKLDRIEEAALAFAKYYPDYEELKLGDPLNYLGILQLEASILFAKFEDSDQIEDLEKADEFYTTALNTINHLWKDNISLTAFSFSKKRFDDLFEGFIKTKINLYERTKNDDHLSECLSILDKHKARILNKSLERNRANKVGSDDLSKQLDALDLKIVNIKDEMLTPKLSEYSALKDSLFELETEKRNLTKTLSEKQSWKDELFEFDLDELHHSLEKNTAILYFFYGDSNVYVFYKEKNKMEYAIIIDKLKLAEELNTFHQSLDPTDPKAWIGRSSSLGNEILSSIDIDTKIENLIIIPDEEMSFLNFELLEYDDKMLIENYNIQYAHSLRVLNQQLITKQNFEHKVICYSPQYEEEFIADADTEGSKLLAYREGLFNLPGAKSECENIAGIFGGKHHSANEATETNFKAKAQDQNIIHLAMHGMLDGENEMNSKLVFSTIYQDSLNDNSLHAYEILNMKLYADLVVLSACNSGKGVFNSGEGVMSLANAFNYAGVHNTVMSLWKIPDESTEKIMTSFYTYLKVGNRIDLSLKKAKLDYLADETIPESLKHPYYWAGFIANGNMNPVVKSHSHNIAIILVLGLFLFSTFIYSRVF